MKEKKKSQSSFLLRTYTEMDPKPGETTREQKTSTVTDSQEEEFSVTVRKERVPSSGRDVQHTTPQNAETAKP